MRPAGALGLHTVVGELRNFTPRSPVIVISTLEQDPTVHAALREITAHGFKLTLIAPDTLEYDRQSRIISPAVYFTASAELDNTISEARSLGARALRWDPDSVLAPALTEIGVVTKGFGLAMTLAGAAAGGDAGFHAGGDQRLEGGVLDLVGGG